MKTLRALSPEQCDSFETHGFLRIPRAVDGETVAVLRSICLRMRDEDKESILSRSTTDNDWRDQFNHPLDEKQAACDEARWEAWNIVASDKIFLDLIDQPGILPAIADLLGDNIFLMSSRAMIRDRVPMSEREFAEFPLDWHRDLGTSALEMTEPHPRLSIKVAYWLTALNGPGQGAMQVVPGSHRLTGPLPMNPDTGHPFGAIEIYAEPGDVLLFEQRLWHAAAPNITVNPRICLFYAYGFRWLRPDDYREVPSDLMDRLSAPRRQLLGAAQSQFGYYLPTSADLPLRSWLDELSDG